jgi:hypothetical protein
MDNNFKARDHELTDVLNKDDQNVKNQKIKDGNAFAKNKWLSQLIRIRLKDSDGVVRPGCEWRITRRKMTKETLQVLVNRCPVPCEVDYLYDSTGTAMWLDDMLTMGMPDPEVYYIVPFVRRMPEDIAKDPRFEGQMCFMISRVPLKCKDESTIVDAPTIKEWLIFALLEVDPYSKPFYGNIEKIKEEIKEIDKRIKQIPKIVFTNEQGEPMELEEADAQREVLYEEFGNQRIAIEERLKRQELALEGHRNWRRNMGVDIQRGEEDMNTGTANWYIRFYGTADAGEMEELLLKKDDWGSIKMACGRHPNLPPWAGRGKIPDGKKAFDPDYTELQVNISGARISRRPHGTGTLKTLDRQSVKISGDNFEFYYGHWYDGKKDGYGFEVSDTGVFSGRFEFGNRIGYGRLDLANGTTVVGPFKVPEQRPSRHYGEFQNPYCNGDIHGDAEVLFCDGGLYKGSMYDGKINGFGKYQSALGEISMGWFLDGVLDGEKGYYKNHAGEEFAGTFNMGEIHGKAFYKNEFGDTYVGFFDHALKHGRGKEYINKKGSYTGYYVNGTKTGKGEIDYGKRKKKTIKKMKPGEHYEANKKKAEEDAAKAMEEKEKKKNNINDNNDRNARLAEKKKKEHEEYFKKEAEAEEAKKKRGGKSIEQEFKNRYQGYFLASAITSGGITMDTEVNIPKVVARRDMRSTYGITQLLKKMSERTKLIKRKIEKYTDMEHSIRREMNIKKIRIFKQQKHYTKKAIYLDEIAEKGISTRVLKARQQVRDNRLEKLDVEALQPKNAVVPRLQFINWKPENSLKAQFDKVDTKVQKGQRKPIRQVLAKVAVSDMDEVRERQRFLKYDNMWERAERAFIDKKKSAI